MSAKRKSYWWEVVIRGSSIVRVQAKTWGAAVYRARRSLYGNPKNKKHRFNTRERSDDGGFIGVHCALSEQQ